MSYAEFLGRWYNLAFLVAGAAGMTVWFVGRMTGRDALRPAAALLVTAVSGLTWNGAIHDLALGSPAPRFPLVAVVSAAVGVLAAWGLGAARDRWFPPLRGLVLTGPGEEGREARVVSRTVGPAPGSGRAHWQDAEGRLHVVRIHTSGEQHGFGVRVRLVDYDENVRSYRVAPLRDDPM